MKMRETFIEYLSKGGNCKKDTVGLTSQEASMKKKLIAIIAAGAMIATMIPAISAYANETEAPVTEAPDYSQEDCWYKIPEITKDVDTFYIYSTIYAGANEGDPEYATLDMEAGVFTELYVEPGVPHAYDAFAGTPQEKRFNELRDNAIARMFRTENDSNVSEKEEGYEGFIKYLIDMYNAEEGK